MIHRRTGKGLPNPAHCLFMCDGVVQGGDLFERGKKRVLWYAGLKRPIRKQGMEIGVSCPLPRSLPRRRCGTATTTRLDPTSAMELRPGRCPPRSQRSQHEEDAQSGMVVGAFGASFGGCVSWRIKLVNNNTLCIFTTRPTRICRAQPAQPPSWLGSPLRNRRRSQ